MVFVIPAYAPTHYENKAGETVAYSEATIKLYKSKLNWLAKQGYDTPEMLMKHVYDIIPLIELAEYTEKAYYKRRLILSAIMYVLPETYKERPNPYYELFRKSLANLATDYVQK